MNFQPSMSSSALWSLLLLGACCAGCQDEAASPRQGVTESLTPKESFFEIVRLVRSRVETGGNNPGRFVMESGGRRSQFVVRNDVESEIIPPESPDDPWRATITINSRSTYSLREMESDDDRDAQREAEQEQDEFSLDETGESGIDALDDNLITTGPQQRPARSDEPEVSVSRQETDDIRTFEFVYEDGRWVQQTETDPETERALQGSFDRALELQP